MKTYWIVLPDCTSFKKAPGIFCIKGGPNTGPQNRVPETRAPAKFSLRCGYSLSYDVIFVDNINVLDLALWAEKILKLNVFLCNLKKNIYCGQLILGKISEIGATRCQILRLKCTKFDFRWGRAPGPAGGGHSAPPDLAVFKGAYLKGEGKRTGKGRGGG